VATAEGLPGCAPILSDDHRAYTDEPRAVVDALPLHAGDRVLDLACGDGFSTRRLAECVGPSGRAIGVDVLPAYLERAARHGRVGGRVRDRGA
jgi:ubiquinone/menaquinone biosynthesis C-methylase UbiE